MPEVFAHLWEAEDAAEEGRYSLELTIARIIVAASPPFEGNEPSFERFQRTSTEVHAQFDEPMRDRMVELGTVLRDLATESAVAPVRFVVAIFALVAAGLLFCAIAIFRPLENAVLSAQRDLVLERQNALAAEKAKSEFLATMSHEIRTPLNGVLGMAELLAGTQLDDRQRMFAGIIRQSGKSLLGVINDILDFSKIDSGHLMIDRRPFRLDLIAVEPARLIGHAAEEKGLELALRTQPDLPDAVIGDLGRIRQVVTNLVSNAVKFTESGQVVIDLSGEQRTSATGHAELALRVAVTDSGIGIPPDMIEGVFDRFTQVDGSSSRRQQGTGLGLAISKGLVELMGGEIGAESRPGAGSTFWFTLTLPIDPAASARARVPPAIESRHVLVIDDNETNRCILQELLSAWRLTESAAASGMEGLQRLVNAAGKGRPFDLVILDHHMPGINGEETLRRLRATPEIAGTPVILLTSIDGLHGGGSEGAGSGGMPDVQAYLVKPAPASQLFDTIIGILGTADQARADATAGTGEAASPPAVAPADARAPVLLVEDNEVNRIVAAQVLERLDLAHVTAENGEEGVARFAESRPSLVLMDLSMPVMDGLDATRRIRDLERERALPRTPIIGLTAHAIQGDRERCLDFGMDDYMSKPVEIDRLAAIIGRWTEGEPPVAGKAGRAVAAE